MSYCAKMFDDDDTTSEARWLRAYDVYMPLLRGGITERRQSAMRRRGDARR